ncbi:unnamed protein product [Gadus morhua 'NCC']
MSAGLIPAQTLDLSPHTNIGCTAEQQADGATTTASNISSSSVGRGARERALSPANVHKHVLIVFLGDLQWRSLFVFSRDLHPPDVKPRSSVGSVWEVSRFRLGGQTSTDVFTSGNFFLRREC